MPDIPPTGETEGRTSDVPEQAVAPMPARAKILERFLPFKTAPTGVLMTDRGGTILAANTCLERMFGYGVEELLGKSVEILLPTAERDGHQGSRDAFFECPVPRQMGMGQELDGIAKPGRRVPVEIGLTTLEIEGEPSALAFVLDLTEHKKQEEKLRLVVEAAPNGIIIVGPHGRIKLANQEACMMFGYSKAELLGQDLEVLLPERFRHKHQVYRNSYFQAPENRAMGAGRDLFAVRKDRSEFPIEIGLTPIDAADGRFIIATLIDITTRKAAEQSERSKSAELRRLNEELTKFTYCLSHDLKAPLSGIEGLARIAIQDLDAQDLDEVRSNLKRIGFQAQQLKQLVQDVLALARADESASSRETVDLAEVVTEVVRAAQATPEAQGVEFRLDLPAEIHGISQRAWLREIVENLVCNAVKYSDPHRARRFVEVTLADGRDKVHLTVRDNGIGIPTKCHAQVFEMFKRFDPGRADGSGLGLAIVKKCVSRSGGEVGFQSSTEGTMFRVTLPRGVRC